MLDLRAGLEVHDPFNDIGDGNPTGPENIKQGPKVSKLCNRQKLNKHENNGQKTDNNYFSAQDNCHICLHFDNFE